MNEAVRVEALKLTRSSVGIVGSAAIVLGIGALCTVMMAALASDDPQLVAKLGPDASRDWPGLVNTAAQISGAGGLLAFGVVAAWLFGREFSDGTITGLFALPVGRGTIAAAKLAVYAAWGAVVSAAVVAAVVLLGLVLGFGAPDAAAWAGLGRLLALGVLSAGVAVPTAWVATITRSLLGGVSVAIGLVVVAQVGVLAGWGGWLPLAAPALWAVSGGGAVSVVQLGGAAAFAGLAATATAWSWHRLQLDR
ncbi:MAG: ABC transporter permease [Ornithinibacter sp.]